MRKEGFGKRLLSVLLALVMIVGLVPAGVLAEVFAAEGDPVIVIAGSDYQNTNGGYFSSGASTDAYAIMSQIKEDYDSAYGFLFGGDYYAHDTNTTTYSTNGKKQLKEEIVDVLYPDMADDTQIYIQGNHDADSLTTNGTLATSGAHDSDYYGVYVINEKDYMWYNDNQSTIKSTASALDTYLDAKVNEGYTKPIFVLSHLPLHFSTRTVNDGDGKYAKYIYDVLDEAGNNGLNIIFLYGHNHSTSYYEAYLGNAAVYLAEGDTIYVANEGSQSSCFSDELSFTYMNYGFTGYLSNSTADGALTMTVFEIYDNEVKVKRYDEDGVHNLKSAGVAANMPSGVSANTTVYTSPQSITLVEGTKVSDNNVSVTAPGLTGLTVTKIENPTYDTGIYSAYASYDITPVGYTQGNTATVTITLDSADGFDTSKPVLVIDKKTNTAVEKKIVNGTVTFTTQHFSTYDIAQSKTSEIEVPNTDTGTAAERTYTRVDNISDLVSGGQYLLILNNGEIMLPEEVTINNRTGFNVATSPVTAGGETVTGELADYEFTMEGSGTSWKLSVGGEYFTYENLASGTDASRQSIVLGGDGTTFTIEGSSGSYHFYAPHISNGTNIYFDRNSSRDLVCGYTYASGTVAAFYIYRLTATASNTPTVDTEGGDWVTITEPTDGSTTYTYTQDTDGVDTNTAYLIVNSSSATAMENNGTSGITTASISVSGTTATTTTRDYEWMIDSSNRIYTTINGTTYYLSAGGSGSSYSLSMTTSSNSATQWSISNNNSAYTISVSQGRRTYYLTTGGLSTSSGTVRLFAYESSTTTGGTNGLYGKIEGELTYNVAYGTSAEEALAAVQDGITIKYATASDYSDEATFADDGAGMSWVLDESYGDGTTPGEYAVTIAYNGTTLGVAKVVVPDPNNTVKLTITADSSSGTVKQGATTNASTGTTLTVTNADGEVVDTVKVTVGMLTDADGAPISTENIDTLTGLDIYYTYNGVKYKVFSNYTLNIAENIVNNYPDYPNEGAVKVNKTATGIDFQSSGVAQVELSVSGVPSKKGVDVIVMVDTSSSMKRGENTGNDNAAEGEQRIDYLQTAVANLLKEFQTPGDDGETLDIRVAIAEFNGYTHISNNQTLDGTSVQTASNVANVFTGSGEIGADAFVDAISITDPESFAANIGAHSGTNYDYAFDTIYRLGSAIQAENTANGEERDLTVIFMSDGAPYQYNYYGSGTVEEWNDYLLGTIDTSLLGGSYTVFYNEDGDHWMAEAVKGDTDADYLVIDPTKSLGSDATDVSDDGNYFRYVKGLGATIHTIGFCLYDDDVGEDGVDVVYEATQQTVMQNLASVDEYGNILYHETKSGSDLNDIFCEIASQIAYAANNAHFEDQMGSNFNIQLTPMKYRPEGVTDWAYAETITPVIEVRSYTIWTREEFLAGDCLESQIGTRKKNADGTYIYTVIEKVSFTYDEEIPIYDEKGNSKGYTYKLTGAYSSLIGDGATNILGEDGVIYAKNFAYNTTSADVTVNGNTVAAESFYWYIGTVTTTEIALNYYVYLEGALEGDRAEGSYATNNYATLYYENYLGNDCYEDTTSPTIAWESALVRYAFYLVNASGQPVNANGQVVTFANRVAVTQPVVYREILLNDLDNVNSIDVASLNTLPDGYTLFDEQAVYTIMIDSNSTGKWEITKGTEAATTYVTDFSTTEQFSNELTSSSEDGTGYDYTHTTVWFAVVWEPKCIPDTVVIDFGLPVDIHVLTNDMFGEYGKLIGVAKGTVEGSATGDTSNQVSVTEATGEYGTVKVITTDSTGATLGKNQQAIRYTPTTMAMNGVDTFTYSVQYSGSANAGYYYGTVTVIPATTVYYEDSFVEYTNSGKADGTYGTWTDAGTALSENQDEDRPGKYSLSYIDANNIYGYDSVYGSCAEFSMGGAKKVTVKSGVSGMASFTFWGTGFDVISMTDTTTGMIIVDVHDASGELLSDYSFAVDTYYGMNEDGTLSANNPTALYQVPVMKVDGLTYGKYTVKIYASYNELSDHNQAGSYNFYLDAIRIYDPAGVASGSVSNTTIENAYKADGEGWPQYTELRNNIIAAEGVTTGTDGTVTFPTDDDMAGAIFIDSNDKNVSIADYVSYGPNNELYLAAGQSVAFKLDQTYASIIADVQIALKVGNGGSVSYKIYDSTKTTADATVAKTLSTATDLYYSIKDLSSGTIVITNSGDSGILSITNIKVTYTQNPYGTSASGLDELEDPNGGIMLTSLYMDEVGATSAVMSLRSAPAQEEGTGSEDVETEIPEESTGSDEVEIPETEEDESEVSEPENGETESETPEVSAPETEEDEPEIPEVEEPEVEENEPETPEVGENESEETESESFFDKIGNFFKKLFGWLFG